MATRIPQLAAARPPRQLTTPLAGGATIPQLEARQSPYARTGAEFAPGSAPDLRPARHRIVRDEQPLFVTLVIAAVWAVCAAYCVAIWCGAVL